MDHPGMDSASSSSSSSLWETALVILEEVYHTVWACLCLQELAEDTYYAFRPKRTTAHLVPCFALLAFHVAFLGRGSGSRLLSTKLVYLLDMLFHVFRVLWDALIFLSVYRCPKGSCRSHLFTASASVTYHVITLVVYYRWCEVRPAQKPPCMVGTCYDWLRQYVHRLKEGGRYVADGAPSAIQLQRTLGDSEECSASFEFSHRRMADGATEHLLSSQSSCSQEIAKAT